MFNQENEHDDLLVLSFEMISLIFSLEIANFTKSEYFNSLKMEPNTRKQLGHLGLANRGTLLISLYAMLVVPWETLRDKYEAEFSNASHDIASLTTYTESNYDETPHQYLHHIRNAVSHARVQFVGANVKFIDKKIRNGAPVVHKKSGKPIEFFTLMPLSNTYPFLERLTKVHKAHFGV